MEAPVSYDARPRHNLRVTVRYRSHVTDPDVRWATPGLRARGDYGAVSGPVIGFRFGHTVSFPGSSYIHSASGHAYLFIP